MITNWRVYGRKRSWPILRYNLENLRGCTEENHNLCSLRIVGDDVVKVRRRGSVVGVVTHYGLEDAGFKSRHKKFCLLQNVHTCSGAHQASYSMGTGFLCRAVKRPGSEVDYSPSSNATGVWVDLYCYSTSTPSWRGQRQLYLAKAQDGHFPNSTQKHYMNQTTQFVHNVSLVRVT